MCFHSAVEAAQDGHILRAQLHHLEGSEHLSPWGGGGHRMVEPFVATMGEFDCTEITLTSAPSMCQHEGRIPGLWSCQLTPVLAKLDIDQGVG